MTLDPERVIQKTAYISEQVSALCDLFGSNDPLDIVGDNWIHKGVKYSLQTAIEACIDLAYHISARKYGYAPSDARDAFERLAKAGLLPEESLKTYSAMIGFRNRLVHGYQQVNPETIARIVQEDLDDLEQFVAIALRLVAEEQQCEPNT